MIVSLGVRVPKRRKPFHDFRGGLSCLLRFFLTHSGFGYIERCLVRLPAVKERAEMKGSNPGRSRAHERIGHLVPPSDELPHERKHPALALPPIMKALIPG